MSRCQPGLTQRSPRKTKISVPRPDEVLTLLRSISKEIAEELMANDPAAARIGESYFSYLEDVAANSDITERAYLNARDG